MWGSGYGMMGSGWGGFGMGLFGMLVWIVVLIAIVAAVVWLLRSLLGSSTGDVALTSRGNASALQILEERYAKGEIDRNEYLEKKRDLQ